MSILSHQRPGIVVAAAVLAGGLACVVPQGARADEAPNGGAVPGALVAAPETTIAGTIGPVETYTKASVGVGGGGLRNRAGTAVTVSNATAPIRAAYLYWAVITDGAPKSVVGKVTVTRRLPTPAAGALVTGTVVGTGATPCWGGTQITVYRAGVPTAVADRNGVYDLALETGASGLTTGESPWDGHLVYPLFEGASLVLIGTGTQTVALYDKALSGRTFGTAAGQGLSYALRLPVTAGGAELDWYNIGADGQSGVGLSQSAAFTGEVTTINGVKVAGPGGLDNDSDWDGSAALPLPQLWDNTGHNIAAAARAGTKTLAISFTSPTDCLVPVANVTAQ